MFYPFTPYTSTVPAFLIFRTDSSTHIFFTTPSRYSNTSSSPARHCSLICVLVDTGILTCSITTTITFLQAFIASYPPATFYVTSACLFPATITALAACTIGILVR
ncbi:hypothetical protein EI94DRAFT_1723692 [Lactarius quietus]|nr:hypothetical protein EI94DRAFT_1723692 [Lactarius quietus]